MCQQDIDKIGAVESYSFGVFQLDLRSGDLRGAEGEISMEPRVFALLAYLIRHRRELITREQLLEGLWRDTDVSDASLSQAVASLRDALHDDPRKPRYISTVPRRGYKFIADVISRSS